MRRPDEFEDMLRCIRCGACMNHCPVYQALGGHAYGWVYPGPMGVVKEATKPQFPNKSPRAPVRDRFCGR